MIVTKVVVTGRWHTVVLPNTTQGTAPHVDTHHPATLIPAAAPAPTPAPTPALL